MIGQWQPAWTERLDDAFGYRAVLAPYRPLFEDGKFRVLIRRDYRKPGASGDRAPAGE